MVPDLTPQNAARFGLTKRQAVMVNLVERRFNRAAIAAYLGISTQTVRDILGGLCDYYNCPTKELPHRVKYGIPENDPWENPNGFVVAPRCPDCEGKYRLRPDGQVVTHFTETLDGRTVLCPKERQAEWIRAKVKAATRSEA